MIIQNIFTNFLALEKTNLDNKKYQDYCYEISKTRNCKVEGVFLDFNSDIMKDLSEVILEKTNELHKHFSFSKHSKQVIYNMWVNLNDTPFITAPHIHIEDEQVLFSGVYYAKAEDSAATLEFVSPIAAHRYVIGKNQVDRMNEFNSAAWSYKPCTGDLIIFPSWLVHYVDNKFNNTDRISIAFNTSISIK